MLMGGQPGLIRCRRILLTAISLYAAFAVLTSTHLWVTRLQKGACPVEKSVLALQTGPARTIQIAIAVHGLRQRFPDAGLAGTTIGRIVICHVLMDIPAHIWAFIKTLLPLPVHAHSG